MTLNELIATNTELNQAVTIGNDSIIQQWLNTPSISASRKIPINEVVSSLYKSGAFVAIKTAAANGNATALLAVDVLRDAKTLGIETVDLSLASNQALFNQLLNENVITQDQIDAVSALALTLISPAEAHGLGVVSIEQIAKALRG